VKKPSLKLLKPILNIYLSSHEGDVWTASAGNSLLGSICRLHMTRDIENWLEQFQTWFLQRERVEQAPVDDREKIETAMQSCEPDVSVALQNHQRQVAEFSTWESFSRHMKATYGSQETGFRRWFRSKGLTQGDVARG
jgi:hypothetical protein